METQRKKVHIDLRSHVQLSLLRGTNERHAPALAAADAAMASSSSTGPMPRPDTPAATPVVHSSADEDARTIANAARQGQLALRISSYNVGVKTDMMCSGPSRNDFEAKLATDVRTLAALSDVIAFQEVSPRWHEFIESVLGEERWKSASIEKDGIVTFFDSSFQMARSTPSLFPPFNADGARASQGKSWRKCLQVSAGNTLLNITEFV